MAPPPARGYHVTQLGVSSRLLRGGTETRRMPVVAYAAGEERDGDGDVVQLVNEFEETTGKVEVTHQTVERDDTRPVPLSERFWDSWYWFWRKLVRVRCSCKKGCQQGCFRERYALAWGIVCLDVVSVILYCIAAATLNWSVVYASPEFDEAHVNSVTDNRFERTIVTLGLFRTFNYSDAGYTIIRRDFYNDIEFYENQLPRWKFALVFALILAAILANLLALGFAVLNSYQLVTSLWKGPPAMYVTNFIAGLIGFAAVAVYIDLHIWDLGDGRRLLEARRDLLVRPYATQAYLGYSFIVCVLAAGLLIASFALAWRILLIFPNLAGPTSIFHQSVVERTTIEDKQSKKKTTFEKKETATASFKRSGSPDLSEAEVIY